MSKVIPMTAFVAMIIIAFFTQGAKAETDIII